MTKEDGTGAAAETGHAAESTLTTTFAWLAALLGATFTGVVLWLVIDAGLYGYWNGVALQHLPSIIGLPTAAVAALVLVVILRTVAGDIQFKILGMEFRGASGPIIMWILCFLAITFAIGQTWKLTYEAKPSNQYQSDR